MNEKLDALKESQESKYNHMRWFIGLGLSLLTGPDILTAMIFF